MTLMLENKKLIFVGGKGGVGKTTSSSAIALHLSEKMQQSGRNGKILLYSTDPAHSLSDSFNIKIGETPTPLTKTLDAMEINTDNLLKEFKQEYSTTIQSLLTKGTRLKKEEVDNALELAIPGIDEFMGLIKLSTLVDDYHAIVVDTAPTGHTIRLLSMPTVVNSWAILFTGLHDRYKNIVQTITGVNTYDNTDRFIDVLTRSIYKNYTLITDTEQTEFIIVTIPDLMAIEETKRLMISLYSIGIKVNNMIINNIQTNLDCPFCRSRRNYQNKYINQINIMYPNINKIYIPLFPEDVNGMAYLNEFKNKLFYQ